MKFAINTADVSRLVEENGVVPLLADWTNGSVEIKKTLKSLNSDSIPVLAIYPADHPGRVYLLRDVITQGQVLDALRRRALRRTKIAR